MPKADRASKAGSRFRHSTRSHLDQSSRWQRTPRMNSSLRHLEESRMSPATRSPKKLWCASPRAQPSTIPNSAVRVEFPELQVARVLVVATLAVKAEMVRAAHQQKPAVATLVHLASCRPNRGRQWLSRTWAVRVRCQVKC